MAGKASRIDILLSPKRSVTVLAILALLFTLSYVTGHQRLAELSNGWSVRAKEIQRSRADALSTAFDRFANETETAAVSIATDEHIGRLLGRSAIDSSSRLFEVLSRYRRHDRSLGAFNAKGGLVAWSGELGATSDSMSVHPRAGSFVFQGPIYTSLVSSSAVVAGPDTVGYIVCRRVLDVRYPINNRFINRESFSSSFTAGLPFPVRLDFSGRDAEDSSASFQRVMLHTQSGLSGSAFLQLPTMQESADAFLLTARRTRGVLALLMISVLFAGLLRRALSRTRPFLSALVLSLALWLVRYSLITFDIPRVFVSLKLFGPVWFASAFGAGLAQSLGDLLLTSAALFGTVLLLGNALFKWYARPLASGEMSGRIVWGIGLSLISMSTLFVVLRSFAAGIQSAVVDSSILFNDPTSVIPSAELSVMLICMLVFGISLVLAGCAALLVAWRLIQAGWRGRHREIQTACLMGGLLSLLAIVYRRFVPHPLLSIEELFTAIVVIFAATLFAGWAIRRRPDAAWMKILPVTLLAAVVITVPVLDQRLHSLDRTHVELLAEELSRPTDTWLSLVVHQALDEITKSSAAEILRTNDLLQMNKLAFASWANSILGREGNNCAVTVIDREGTVVSDFHIGSASHWSRLYHMDEMPRSTRMTSVEEEVVNGSSVRWYQGYAPVVTTDGEFVGGVWIRVSPGSQRLGRELTPEILRNSSSENTSVRFRSPVLFEYYGDHLVYASDEQIPLRQFLPDKFLHGKDSLSGGWMDQTIDGRAFEMYYFSVQSQGQKTWYALGMPVLDFGWHFFSFVRYGIFTLTLGLLFGGAVALIYAIRRKAMVNIRTRLLLAFAVVSLIPVMIIAYYNAEYASERATELTLAELKEETALVLSALQQETGLSAPVSLQQVSDELCEKIAGRLDIDFNVYSDRGLISTSRPEMFAAELLDPHLSSEAYVNVIMARKSFYAGAQSIGSLLYMVGFRPIMSENGSIMGVVSVPTLYRQTDIEEDLSHRNTLLLGAYILALIVALVAGTLMANRISSPLRRLRRATEQIALGRLDIDLKKQRGDELGELEQAFGRMAKDLRQTQEQMARTERELAWREMARQVAHEIKNPLTPMKLSVQHLRQAFRDRVTNLPELLETITNTVLEQIEALSRIATEFSNYARMPGRHLEDCDVHAVITEAINLYQRETVTWSTAFAATDAVVLADREELRRAFINLIRNSIQAMGEFGAIRFMTAVKAEFLEVTITDNGPGIPPHVFDHLFEPNFSTKTDGMGLGLTIVKTIIEQINGTIAIESTPGQGTTVSLRLPLASRTGTDVSSQETRI